MKVLQGRLQALPACVYAVAIQPPTFRVHPYVFADDKHGLRLVGAAVDELRNPRTLVCDMSLQLSGLQSPQAVLVSPKLTALYDCAA